MEVVKHRIFTVFKGNPKKRNCKSNEALGLLKSAQA